MVSKETGKDRADRIPYRYLQSGDPLIFRRLAYSFVAVLAAFAWIGWGWADPDSARRSESHGPLSRAHATWDNRCDKCHTTDESLLSFLAAPKFDGLVSTAGDKKCMACHMGLTEQAHHADVVKNNLVPHCVQCHSEHQGKDFSLVRLADTQCTQCHSKLETVRNGQAQLANIIEKIDGFSKNHPDFRFRRFAEGNAKPPIDPGKLKFNHALHLNKGIRPPNAFKPSISFADLRSQDLSRYGWKPGTDLNEPVQLDCASCHHFNNEGLSSSLSTFTDHAPENSRLYRQMKPGAYAKPISFANDCAACHPLDVTLNLADKEKATRIEIPHGLQPRDVLETVRSRVLKSMLGRSSDALKEPEFPIDLGKPAKTPEFTREWDRRVDSVGRVLFGAGKVTCSECHYYESPKGMTIPDPEPSRPRADLKIVATGVPEIWMKHGRFDHSAHRAVDCNACHVDAKKSGAQGGDSPSWRSHEDVILPGIDNCVQCHSPAKAERGGASDNCTECHLYHDRDASIDGLKTLFDRKGSPLDAKQSQSIKGFLNGEDKP